MYPVFRRGNGNFGFRTEVRGSERTYTSWKYLEIEKLNLCGMRSTFQERSTDESGWKEASQP